MAPHEPKEESVLGTSEAMRQLEMLLRRVADIDSSLLITGESGVGKEVAAKFVHQISARAAEPFVAVNCGAIPNELIEIKLFGHEKGAFTGALARYHGYVERARNGILFLDEIGELPMLTQVKLPRVIQERAFTRVGGEVPIKTGARIICATNTDLEAAVAEGRFRGDLSDRISLICIAIPPLRDRTDDILPLAQRFMREFVQEFDRDIKGFTPAAERALLEHSWPGNVRELRNRVQRAVAFSTAQLIAVGALLLPDAAGQGVAPSTLAKVRDRAERRHIRAVLADVGNRIEEAAKSGGRMPPSRDLEKAQNHSGVEVTGFVSWVRSRESRDDPVTVALTETVPNGKGEDVIGEYLLFSDHPVFETIYDMLLRTPFPVKLIVDGRVIRRAIFGRGASRA
jgi:DNA-binding NtrC family response regulator